MERSLIVSRTSEVLGATLLILVFAILGGAVLSCPIASFQTSPSFADSPSRGESFSIESPLPRQPDSRPPEINITSPPDRSVVTTATLVVSGTASDNARVARVDLSTDATTWTLASGIASWSGTVALVNGTNTIFARATDAERNQAFDMIVVVARLSGPAPEPTGFDFSVLMDPVLQAFVLVLIVVAAATVAFLRRRPPPARRIGGLPPTAYREGPEEGPGRPPAP